MLANGQEFKQFIEDCENKPDIICIQETWLKPHLDFIIYGYVCVRRDRVVEVGGGCATFIKEGLPYRALGKGQVDEYVVVEVWLAGGPVVVINFYNPCKRLELNTLSRIEGQDRRKIVWCGDFNSHNTLWGGERTDCNGQTIEELMDEKQLICLNDGRGTRIDVSTGHHSVLDLTLVSYPLAAGYCEWEVCDVTTIGSDHYPIVCKLGFRAETVSRGVGMGKWIFEKAKWDSFLLHSEQNMMSIEETGDVNIFNEMVSSAIYEAAIGSIPRSKGKMRRKAVPWWTEQCSDAVKKRNKAFRDLKRTHSFQNLIDYKRAQAVVRRTVRQAKRSRWQTFCERIGRTTPVGEVWGMVKKMGGNRREWDYPVLKENDVEAVNDKDKAEMMVKAFVKVNSSDNLSDEGKSEREQTMREHSGALGRKESSGDVLDAPFTLEEMKRAIGKSKNSSPGKDQICYIMMKHLGVIGLYKLLSLYNKIWQEGMLPARWKEAVIIPIRKPGKDPTKPTSYRPIALTSHMCKIMERMITERLTYYLESKGLIASYQSGFRKGRGTMDPVVCLESDVRKALGNKESLVAVFFDVEKAYDMMWKEGLLIRLHLAGVGGRVFNWIKDFLFGRAIQVKVGSELSDKLIVENGTPQGSVISPLLFIIMINEVFARIGPDIGKSLYADDGALWKRGRDIQHLVRKIQEGIGDVEQWGYKWGFKFSIEKTKAVFFTRKKIGAGLRLKMYGESLENVGEFRFLGVTFDSKMTWAAHIRKIVDKCKKIINVMRCITGMKWGASKLALRTLYVGLIRSVLDYGCVAYGSAAKTHLVKLDVIQSQALRICIGAVRTSPVCAVQVENGEMPLCIRRKHLMANYWTHIKGHDNTHPVKLVLQPCWEHGRTQNPSFGWVGNDLAEVMGVNRGEFSKTVVFPDVAPWLLKTPKIDFHVLDVKRRERGVVDLVTVFNNHVEREYSECVQIYTDGSVDPETGRTGAAFVVPGADYAVYKRAPDKLGVYTMEMYAVFMALQWVEREKPDKVVVLSDSSSILKSLQSFRSKCREDLMYQVLQLYSQLSQMGVEIQFMWVPAHVGIEGNESVDMLAKEALVNEDVELDIHISKAEAKSIVWGRVVAEWQQSWDEEQKGRHYYQFHSKVNGSRTCRNGSRREEVIITRLKLGHSALNKTLQLMGKHPTGLCENCQEEESAEHAFMHCSLYQAEREIMFEELREVGTVEVTFKKIICAAENNAGRGTVFRFIKETGLWDRI